MNNISGNITQSTSLNGSVNKPTTVYVQELCFESYYDFPAIGEDKKLYIATNKDELYRFDTTNNVYKCIGKNIEAIQCTIN